MQFTFRVPNALLRHGTNKVAVTAHRLFDEPFFDGLGPDWKRDEARAERAILHQVELEVVYKEPASDHM